MPETRILVDTTLRAELEAEGLLDLDKIAARKDLEVVKARLASRQTYKLRTAAGRVLYVKLYRTVRPEARFARLFARGFQSMASREWHVVKRLHEIGIPTMRLAACIEEVAQGRVTRAASITIGLSAPRSLQRMMLEDFGEHPQPRRRQSLAYNLGAMLRDMHAGGVNHRDFYMVHLRVDQHDGLHVTDLNRADIRKRVTRRWRVKDMAALLHSAPGSIVTATDLARVAKTYFGSHLRAHRAFIKAVFRKAERMTAHTRRRIEQGEANYHLVEDV